MDMVYRIDVYHLLFRTYNLNMVALTMSYQVGFGPCAVQVLQLFQPLYLLIMILQKLRIKFIIFAVILR